MRSAENVSSSKNPRVLATPIAPSWLTASSLEDYDASRREKADRL